ncbi:MAG: hypothetical protein ACE5HE_02485 [Phycisphaerae bacterium]
MRRAEREPVALTLTATPAELDIDQHLAVRVDIVADKGVTINARPYDRALEATEQHFDYRVVRTASREAKPTRDGKLRWVYEYELEFFLAGDYELPGAELAYLDAGSLHEEGDDQKSAEPSVDWQTLATERLPVTVRQPAGSELSAEELANIKTLPPVELPRAWGYWLWLGPTLLAAVVLLVVLLVRRRRRAHVRDREVLPADVWARRELAALVAEDLVGKGLFKAFYYRVSDIVRGYVERRFGILAPEMTTEEFLASAASDQRFGEQNTGELVEFLNACDLVKYAKHRPHPVESDRLIKAAGAFVERTRERIPAAGTGASDTAVTREHAA